MRASVLVSIVLVAVVAILGSAQAEELYSDKYDYIDPMEIVKNDKLRDQYYMCFMDTGPCVTDDAKFFRSHLVEAMVTKCRKCTEKQKKSFAFLVEWYNDNRLDEWNALVEKIIEEAKRLNIQA